MLEVGCKLSAAVSVGLNGCKPRRLTKQQVLRELDGRLRDFQQIILRGGALSYSTAACAEAFGEEVAWFYARTATTPRQCVLLDSVLAEESMLKKEFSEAPPGAELVVMEVVSVNAEANRPLAEKVDPLSLVFRVER